MQYPYIARQLNVSTSFFAEHASGVILEYKYWLYYTIDSGSVVHKWCGCLHDSSLGEND